MNTDTTPAIRSRGDIEELKRGWERDPTWDIEETEGYAAHRDELRAYRLEREAQWRAHEENRLAMERQGCDEDWLRQAIHASRNAHPADAHLFAAIAQAEALTRIAEVLETMLDHVSVHRVDDAVAAHVAAAEASMAESIMDGYDE